MTTIVLIKMTFCQQMISDVVWLVMTNISRWFSGAFVKSWERLLPLIISKHQFSPSRREDDNDEIMSDEEEDLDYYDDADSEIPEYNHRQTWKPKFYAIQNWSHPTLQFCWSVHLQSSHAKEFFWSTDLKSPVWCVIASKQRVIHSMLIGLWMSRWSILTPKANLHWQCVVEDILGVLIVYLSNDHKWAIYRGRLA